MSERSITKYEMIDLLSAVSVANGVAVKYARDGDYRLTRQECAALCKEIFHLTDRPCTYEDLHQGDRFYGAVGAVSACGIMEGENDRFNGNVPVTMAEAQAIAEAAGCYQRKLRSSYRPFKATCLQFNPQLFKKEENIARLYAEVERAFQDGAKLVIAPETSISSYVYFDREEIEPYTETLPGKATDLFAELAAKYHGYIAMGVAELDPDSGNIYNASALVGPYGYIGKYRKTHQWETEKHWSVDGDLGVPVYSTELGNIAMIICIDTSYYEAARLAAINGADIILYHTTDQGESIWAAAARAAENGVYLLSANRSDRERDFMPLGCSAIWGPDGDKLAEGTHAFTSQMPISYTEHISAAINPARFNNENKKRLLERRPEVYRELTLTITPWDKRKSTVHHDVTALSVQYTPVLGDVEANKAKIKALVEDAYDRDSKINFIVLPEYSLTGPLGREAPKYAEDLDGVSTAFFSEIAKSHSAALVFSMVERDGDKLYHTAVVLESDGSVLGTYRKLHPNAEERAWATPGNKVKSFASKTVGRIGVILGDEYLFPEVADLVMIKRADLIALPIAYVSGGGKIEANRHIVARAYPKNAVLKWDAIAIYTQAYLVVANYTGTEANYVGGSGLYTVEPIFGHDMLSLAGAEECGFVTRFETLAAEAWWIDQEKRVGTRRAAHYKPLIV